MTKSSLQERIDFITEQLATIPVPESTSHLHYVRVQFDGFADPSNCHPAELDYLAPDEIEPETSRHE